MLAGKNQGAHQPTAFGSMLQAATYGATIPVIYGRTLSPLLVTWANNLRQGGSTKKFKQMKKGITAYAENITFLLGKNPVLGVLQMWNNGAKYPLGFVSTTTTAAPPWTISDPNFYAVVGVTVTQPYSAIFGDYGSTQATQVSGEAQTIPGSGPYTVTVTNASAYVSDQGVKYASGGAALTKITSGTPAAGQYLVNTATGVYTFAAADASKGVLISYTYGSLVSGSYEVPLWNELVSGPDPVGNSGYRNWPYCYRWQPSYGATVQCDAPTPFAGQTVKIYYAQLNSATLPNTPIGKNRLHFEATLGNGSEYTGYSGQQILYPHYAGMGSDSLDLGSSGTIPQLNAEVQGRFSVYPAGDADFVDILEDVLKSGITQAGLGSNVNFGTTQHGTAASDFPGCIQKKLATSAAAGGALPAILYDLPNTAGNLLVAISNGSGAMTISSSAGETWAPVLGASSTQQVWTASAVGGTNTVTISGAGATATAMVLEVGGVGAVDTSSVTFAAGGAGGTLMKGGVYSFATNQVDFQLSNFQLSGSLPGDAVIQGIYAVAKVASPIIDNGGNFDIRSGLSSGPGTFPGWSTTSPAPGEYYAASIGNQLSALQNMVITASLADSVVNPAQRPCGWLFGSYYGSNSIMSMTGGYAIYYTSATPTIDPYLPPPFPVPAGQGLAWALPHSGLGDFPYCPIYNCGTWINVQSGNVSVATPGGGFIGQISSPGGGSFVLSGAGGGSIASSVSPGQPGYLLSVPFYSSSAPTSNIVQWRHESEQNFYGKTPAPFQVHSRIIHNPGSYNFNPPGTTSNVAMLSVKSAQPVTFPNPFGDFLDPATRELLRTQCRAGGLWGSLSMNAQKPAREWIKDLVEAANCAPVMSGFALKLNPRSEASAAGNGAIYTAPTAAGPVAALDARKGDFIAEKGKSPILVKRAARTDLNTIVQMQHYGRNSDYQQIVTAVSDAASIVKYGVRKADPTVNNAIQDPTIARAILQIQVRRKNYVEPISYSFRLNARWQFLEAWDLITITDRSQGIVNVPVRLTSVDEDDKYELSCEAEPFLYGIHAPGNATVDNPQPYSPSTGASAGNVNAPVIFEPVPRLYSAQNQQQLWLAVSSSNANYGGCQVYISTDGGNSYNPAGQPLTGSAITGVTVGSWPAASSPDTTNDLAVDLTESLGVLQSYQTSDEDNFVYPCYVAGTSSPIPYELMTYATATLTAANKYTLKATGVGNHLDRGVFGAPSPSAGALHAAASRFAFLPPSGQGILKLTMDPTWIGKTLWFKFPSFNTFGSGQQSLSGLTAYSYAPTGGSGSVNPGGAPPQQFQVNGA